MANSLGLVTVEHKQPLLDMLVDLIADKGFAGVAAEVQDMEALIYRTLEQKLHPTVDNTEFCPECDRMMTALGCGYCHAAHYEGTGHD